MCVEFSPYPHSYANKSNPPTRRENDEEVGLGEVDDRVLPALPEPSRADPRTAALEKLFIEIAGDDMEIDWMELKRILDHSMRDGE